MCGLATEADRVAAERIALDAQGWRGQKLDVDRPGDFDGNTEGLGQARLDGRAMVRPVDKIGDAKRQREQHDDKRGEDCQDFAHADPAEGSLPG